jgi:hypothetical protein
MRHAVLVLAISIVIHAAPAIAQSKTAKPTTANRYQEAKDLIRRARSLLKDFVAQNPGGEDAYFARVQLAALENIFRTDAPVVPVMLSHAVQWRVVRVDVADAHTKVTLEIENTSAEEEGRFSAFDKYPLTLVANKKVYAMKKGGLKRPAGVEIDPSDRWILQPTQAITVDLYFDALDEGAIDGLIKYIDLYRDEKPARFSLMNVNQRAAAEP